MSGLDRLIADPVTFLLLGLIWLCITIWIVTFLSWGIMGDLEGWLTLLCCGVAIALGILATKPPHPALMWAVGGFIILSLPIYPFLRKAHLDRLNATIDLERMAGAYETLAIRPGNVGAQFRIAEVLYLRGYGRIAIPVAEEALRSMPKNIFGSEHRTVEGWRRTYSPSNEPEVVRCPLCGGMNVPSDVFCDHCQGPYLLAFARGAWAPSGWSGRILAGWLAGACLTIGIPAVTTASMEGGSKVVLIIAMAMAAVWLLIRALAKVFER